MTTNPTEPALPKNVSAKVAQQVINGDYAEGFETVYKHADQNPDGIPWANVTTHPRLVEWLEKNDLQGNDRCAIVLGCGLGDDAEKLAELGFQVTAFDVSPTAIEWAKQRFPQSKVDYQVADLFKLPAEWQSQFDFVLEIYTVQSLPQSVREKALQAIPPLLKTGGQLLLICGAREHDTIPEGPPWRISKQELTTLEDCGLTLVHEEDFVPDTGRRQFRMLYQK